MEKYDEEIEELERKLADYRDIICQQEIMIEVSSPLGQVPLVVFIQKALEEGREVVKLQNPLVSGHVGQTLLYIAVTKNESHYLKRMELLDLREEKNTDREEHLKLEECKLLDAARKLDRDVSTYWLGPCVLQFAYQRQDFEDKKAQFLKQQLECSAFATPNKTSSHCKHLTFDLLIVSKSIVCIVNIYQQITH